MNIIYKLARTYINADHNLIINNKILTWLLDCGLNENEKKKKIQIYISSQPLNVS